MSNDNTTPNDAAAVTSASDTSNAAPAATTVVDAAAQPQNDGGTPAADATKPADQKPADDATVKDAPKPGDDKTVKDAPKDAAKPAPRAPEKYDSFEISQGNKLAPEVQTKFETILRELDLPQADAQKLLTLAPEIGQVFNKQLDEKIAQATVIWKESTRTDKEIGGGGDKATLDANLAYVAKARDAFATPEFLKMLEPFDAKTNPEGTGFGNHPEVVRLLMKVGKTIGEDNKVVTGNGAADTRTAAEKLYSKTTPK